MLCWRHGKLRTRPIFRLLLCDVQLSRWYLSQCYTLTQNNSIAGYSASGTWMYSGNPNETGQFVVYQHVFHLAGYVHKAEETDFLVLTLVAEGRSYRWIARDLGLSNNTVAAIVGRTRVDAAAEIETVGKQSPAPILRGAMVAPNADFIRAPISAISSDGTDCSARLPALASAL